MYLELEHIRKTFGDKVVIDDLSFSLEKGKLLCILGSSGCGKSTTLNIIGGFLTPDSGRVILDGEDITNIPPEFRPVTTVFQSYGLFPHMTVIQNVIYGLKFRGYDKKTAIEKGKRYLEMVGLKDYENAHISEISGGQQQRVALARALIVEPKLCLLDEPFSNLDAALRVKMRLELKRLQEELGITMVFVTHDQEETLILADYMTIMNEGKLVQMDIPENVYKNSSNEFVSEFLGLKDIIWSEDGKIMKVVRYANP
jgi:iron(III) transport system ATP-binding protein